MKFADHKENRGSTSFLLSPVMSASEGLEYNKARGNFNFRWVAMKRLSATAGLLVLVGLMVLGGGFARTEDPQKPADGPKPAAADAQKRDDKSPRALAKAAAPLMTALERQGTDGVQGTDYDRRSSSRVG